MKSSPESDLWGCPAWKNADAYPSTSERLKDWQWRWEFLRRCPKYRMLWAARKGLGADAIVTECGQTFRNWVHHAFNLPELIDPHLSHAALGISPFEFEAGSRFQLPRRDVIENEWFFMAGIESEDYKGQLDYLLDYLEMVGLLEGLESRDPGEQFTFVRYDMWRPLEPQFEYIKNLSKAWKNMLRVGEKHRKGLEKYPEVDTSRRGPPLSSRLGGTDRENWPLYLRLIDAEDQKAKPMEIYKQIASELESDVEAFDAWADSNNPTARIMTAQRNARALVGKASVFL